MGFFKPEDFYSTTGIVNPPVSYEVMACIANAKLEREGKIVYGMPHADGDVYFTWNERQISKHSGWIGNFHTHKGILICAEPIEACTHPKEKIIPTYSHGEFKAEGLSGIRFFYHCECGALVRPKEFEAME